MRWLSLCVVLCIACVRVPADPENRQDAVGYVSVSAPLFSPLNDASRGDERLDFGDLRREDRIAEALQTPTFGISRIDYSMLELLLAARITGSRIDHSESIAETTPAPAADATGEDAGADTEQGDDGATPTTSSGDDAGGAAEPAPASQRTVTRTRNTTIKSPEAPPAPSAPSVDAEVLERLRKLLDPSGTPFRLPPDVLASLVAAIKTQMVNLEQYYNVDGFDYVRGLQSSYVPYRVHFTATAEPGWYSRHHRHDAVLELMFGDGRRTGEAPEYIVLSVTPSETAEILSEFAASLKQVAAALSLEGTFRKAALTANLNHVRASAKRLEGVRAGSTMVVGFPGHDKVRVRFMATTTATEQRRDHQPRARLLTALVLVKNTKDGKALGIHEMWRPGKESAGRFALKQLHASAKRTDEMRGVAADALRKIENEVRERPVKATESAGAEAEEAKRIEFEGRLGRWHRLLYSAPDRLVEELNSEGEGLLESPKIAPDLDLTPLRTAAIHLSHAELATIRSRDVVKELQNSFDGRQCEYSTKSWYAPSLWYRNGKWAPPREPLPGGDQRLAATSGGASSWIPPWLGPLTKKLEIKETFGYYHPPLAEKAAASAALAEAERGLAKAKSKVAKTIAEESKKHGIPEVQKTLEEAKAKLAKIQRELKKEREGRNDAGKIRGLEADEESAKSSVQAEKDKLDSLLETKIKPIGTRANKPGGAINDAKILVEDAKARLKRAHAASLTSGKAVIGLRVDAAEMHLSSHYEVYVKTQLWVRARAATGRRTTFEKIGSGPRSAVLEIDCMDLGLAVPTDAKPEGLRTFGILLDVVLLTEGKKPSDHLSDALERAVGRVILRPSVGATLPPRAPAAQDARSPAAPDKKPASTGSGTAIELDLTGAKITLEAEKKPVVPPTPTPAATGGT